MSVIEGLLTVTNEKFCIIVSRFNEFITSKLLSGAVDELKRHGVKEDNIDIDESIQSWRESSALFNKEVSSLLDLINNG